MPLVTDKLSAAARSLRRRFTGWDGLRWMVGVVLALAAGILLSWWFWDDLRADQESLSATIRNLGLVIGGVIAILLAVWRSRVAERQADTAQRGLLNERYQKGAEMLGNAVLSVRLGGIYALQRLAEEHPEQYHVQIMRLFCAFARNPTPSGEDEGRQDVQEESFRRLPSPREDVQAVMGAIRDRHEKRVSLERKGAFRLDMRGADLSHAVLSGANLRNVDFMETNLSYAFLDTANLSGAMLFDTNLSGARLMEADLSGAVLVGAILKDTDLSGAKLSRCGQNPAIALRQSQLDEATADANNPPNLDGVDDVRTRQPLVWRDR